MLIRKKFSSIAIAATATIVALSAMSMSGCAASNSNGTIIAIFFPKERAVRAADSVIDDIMGLSPAPAILPATAAVATVPAIAEVEKK